MLRGDLGFDGLVMTDWFAVGSTVDSANAGLDLQMPGPDRFYGAPLAKAVADGDLEVEVLDGIVRRWLQLIDRLGAWDDQPVAEQSVELPEHRAIAHRAAWPGHGAAHQRRHPAAAGTGPIALIGPLAARAHIMGGGSAQLRPHRSPSLYDVMGAAATGGLRARLRHRQDGPPACRFRGSGWTCTTASTGRVRSTPARSRAT